ncbi:MAG: glutamine--fructose-6-phosphate transaminase [Gammaproteobacteria bacterium]|jgi:glucosamine--fructose-6-phosphate aminotransferase (isomerizing)|nr:glutamine--fructose-6-phosphate transaminase [Gammaproteobacteria bacterium]
MCGIVAGVAKRNITPILLEGLRRLEYRGYDSAGIAVIENGEIHRVRALGKVSQLSSLLLQEPIVGSTGIAHTRWATHGKPSEHNAHPHMSEDVALVHNGIIENYTELREKVRTLGYESQSETDSETAVHLVHQELSSGKDLLAGVMAVVAQLTGAYALVIMSAREPKRLIGVRCGCPLVVGLGDGETFLASDAMALNGVVDQFIFLEEGDIADITTDGAIIYDAKGKKVERPIRTIQLSAEAISRGHYRHFMLKEIYEQSQAISATLEGRVSSQHVYAEAFGDNANAIFDKVHNIQIVACGTSYHAGLVARYWLEEWAGIACQVEVASEFRYRKKVIAPNTLFVVISQSGETADTLAALTQAKKLGYLATLAICNVAESTMVREADLVFMTRAGIEVGVASTKAFTTQLVGLLLLTMVLAKKRGLDVATEQSLIQVILHLPKLMLETLKIDLAIQNFAPALADKEHALFLGRGASYPIAMEGALKLKEISYIHAESYAAGELKHGPLALVDKTMPVFAVAPSDQLLEKLSSNLQEVRARGGQLYVFSEKGNTIKNEEGITVFYLPTVHPLIAPIIYTIPMQLLAYHVAVIKGTDVDQPRNLAKSVTVE